VATEQRGTTVLKLIVIYVTEIQIMVDVDGLWQTVPTSPFSEKQALWLTLELYLVTVRVIEWTECSRLNRLF